MTDESLHFSAGIENEDFLAKIDEMMKALDTLTNLTSKDAAHMVDSLLSTTDGLKELSQSLIEVKDLEISASSKKRTAREAEKAITEAMMLAEEKLRDANIEITRTYEEQAEKVREIERTYRDAQRQLEEWKGSESYDETIYHRQLEGLQDIQRALVAQKEHLGALRAEAEATAKKAEEGIERTKKAVTDYVNAEKSAEQARTLSSEKKILQNALEEKSTKELAQIYAQQRTGLAELEKSYQSGDVELGKLIASEKEEIAVVESLLMSRSKGMTLMREFTDMLMKENMTTRESTAMKTELQKIIKEVGTAYREATREQQQIIKGGGQIAGVVSGLQGLMGAFTAAQGVLGMFVKNNEDLVRLQTRLQSVMAITIGLQQIHNTLHSTSAFRIQTVTAVTRLYTQAQNGLAVALGISTAAAKALMATLTLGLSVAITAVVALVSKFISKLKEKKEATREAEVALKELNDKIADQSQKVNELVAVLNSENTSQKAKVQALKELQALIPDINGKINEQTGAVDYSREAVEKYISALKLEIEAEVLRGKMKEAVAKQMSLASQLESLESESLIGKTKKQIRDWSNEVLKVKLESQAAAKEVNRLGKELSQALGTLLEIDKDSADARAQKEAVQALLKESEKMQEQVLRMREKLSQDLLNETVKRLEQEQKEVESATIKAIQAEAKAFAEGMSAEKSARELMTKWRIANITDENEKAQAQNQKNWNDELKKVQELKQKYLNAFGLTELSGEMKELLENLTQQIDTFYSTQQKRLESEIEGNLSILRKQANLIFGDISELSASYIKEIISNADKYLQNADISDESVSRFKKAIDRANEYLVKKNPFEALSVARKRYEQALKDFDVAKQVGDIEKQNEALREQASALRTIRKAYEEVGSVIKSFTGFGLEIGQMLGVDAGIVSGIEQMVDGAIKLATEIGIVSEKLRDVGKTASDTIQKVAEATESAGEGVSKVGGGVAASGAGMVGAIIAIVGAIIQIGAAIAQVVNAVKEKKINEFLQKVKANIDRLKMTIDAMASTSGIGDSLITEDVFNKIKRLNEALIVLQRSMVQFLYTGKKGREAFYAFEKITKLFGEMPAFHGWDITDSVFGTVDIEKLQVYINTLKDLSASASGKELGWIQEALGFAELYLEKYTELRDVLADIMSDLSSSILSTVNSMWKEIKTGGEKTFGDLAAAAKRNVAEVIEEMVSQQLWATTMGGYFDALGEDLADAILQGGDIMDVFDTFWAGMEVGLREYTKAYDAFLDSASAAGWDLFAKDATGALKEYAEGSLGWIEQEIKNLNDEIKGLTAEDLATEFGQGLVKRLTDLKEMQSVINDIISGGKGDVTKTEGSISWLQEQISDLTNQLNNLSQEDFRGEAGAALTAQIKEYEDLLKGLESFYEVISGDVDIPTSINALKKELSELEARKNALSEEDLTGEIGQALIAEIEALQEKLNFLEGYYNVVQSKEELLLEKSLEEFETSEKERERIVKDYTEKIAVLRKYGYDEEADLAEQALLDYLSDVELAGLQSSEEWKQLFENMVNLTVEEAEAALLAVIELVENAEDLTDDAKEKIKKDLEDIRKDIEKIKTDPAQEEFDALIAKVKEVEESLSAIADILRTLGQGELADAVEGVSQVVNGISAMILAFADGGVGVILTAIATLVKGIVSSVQALSKLLSKDIDTSRIEALAKEYDRLTKAIENAAGAERKALQTTQLENITARQRELEHLIAKEEKKWRSPYGIIAKGADKEKIADWRKEIELLNDLMLSLEKDWQTDYLTTSFVDFSKTIAEIASDTTKSVLEMEQSISDAVKSMIRNMIVEFLRIEILEAPLKAMFDNLWEVSEDGKKMIDKASLKAFEQEALELGREFYDAIQPMFDGWGLGTSGARESIKSITEPQADILIGEVHGLRIVQVEMRDIQKSIKDGVFDSARLNAEMLSELRSIRISSNELFSINSLLKDIRDKNVLAGTGLGV